MEVKKMFRTARLLTAAGTIAGLLGFLTCSAGMAQNATTINANGAFGSVSTEFGFTFLSLDVTRGGTGANQTTLLFYFTQTPTSDCTATTTDGNGLIPNGDLVGGVGLSTDNRLTLNVDTSAVPGFSNETCIQDYCAQTSSCSGFSGGPITADWENNHTFILGNSGTVSQSFGNVTVSSQGSSNFSSASVQGDFMGNPFQEQIDGEFGVRHGAIVTVTRSGR
jgi:hypothetical protein